MSGGIPEAGQKNESDSERKNQELYTAEACGYDPGDRRACAGCQFHDDTQRS